MAGTLWRHKDRKGLLLLKSCFATVLVADRDCSLTRALSLWPDGWVNAAEVR